MLKSYCLKQLISCSLVILPTLAVAQTERELDAHVHGAATMQVALEGNSLLINLESPAANLVGFEHTPETAQDKKQIEDVKARLADIANVVAIPGSADCSTRSAAVEWESVGDHGHDHDEHEEHDDHGHEEHAEHEEHEHEEHDDHGHEEHDEHAKHEEHADHGHDQHDHDEHAEEDGGGHAEFHAAYTLECSNPGEIEAIDVVLFREYPALETLSVEAVLPSGQTAGTLTAESSRLSITN